MSATPRTRQRLDGAMVAAGLADTTDRAQALIAAGLVELDGSIASSAAQPVTATMTLRLKGPEHPWASRGGIKLDSALTTFQVDCHDRVVLDGGASTGGFTSVLLSRGAAHVYCVDVGHGQLLTQLVRDPRVTVMDRTNLRSLTVLPGAAPSLVTLDLSFISLRRVIPALLRIAAGAEVVALFKPQFEMPRGSVGEGGIVRDTAAAADAAVEFLSHVEAAHACTTLHPPLASPIRGAKGNQEWLLHFQLGNGGGGA